MTERVVSNPRILGGKPVIRGTRISVEVIPELFASGARYQHVLHPYPHLTAEDTKAALRYASYLLKNEKGIAMNETKTPEDSLPVHSDPEIMSGVPVFCGTRVPVQTLFDYLMDGCSVPQFLENFPTVRRDHVMQVLQTASSRMLEGAASR